MRTRWVNVGENAQRERFMKDVRGGVRRCQGGVQFFTSELLGGSQSCAASFQTRPRAARPTLRTFQFPRGESVADDNQTRTGSYKQKQSLYFP